MTGYRLLVVVALAVLPASGGAAPAAGEGAAAARVAIDGRTEQVLVEACAHLRSAERFSVDMEVAYDDVLKDGRKVQYSRDATVVVERPGRLRADVVSDKGPRSFFYDGKTVTVYRPEQAVYAVFEAPATIDATLDAAEARGVEMPLNDLLRAQPCAGLAEHLKSGRYAGRHYLDGGWTHHLLLETEAVDVQIWVADGDAPEIRKVVITYRQAPGAPQYSAVLTDWNFAPATDATTFAFTPPAGVRRVAYKADAEAQGGGK
jgi:hypothetical protein